MKINNKNGFSLIELIVVVTIIMVVSMVGLVSFSGSNQKARDSRRMADMEKIRIGLEMARQTGATYPARIEVLTTLSIMSAIPLDPKTGTTYPYIRSATSNYQYNLYGRVESVGSTNYTAPAISCGAAGNCNYRIANP